MPNKWTIGWGLTARCDLTCDFCYSKNNRKYSEIKDVNLDDSLSFIKRNKQHITSINFGTGESFIMPGFPEFLKNCKEVAPKIKLAVTTNGAILEHISNDEYINIFKNTIDEIDISLDFSDPKKHDGFRGKKGAWQRAVSALELCMLLGLETSIVMVATPDTIEGKNVLEMLTIADHFNASLRINIYMPSEGDHKYALSFEQLLCFIQLLRKNSQDFKTSDPLIKALQYPREKAQMNGYHSFRFLPNSTISPSTYLVEEPWAKKIDLNSIDLDNLRQFENIQQWQKNQLPYDCKHCLIRESCKGGSRERRLLWYGSLNERDPYCPLKSGKEIDQVSELLNGSQKTTLEQKGPNIHLDYLPTTICKPDKQLLLNSNRCAKALFVAKDSSKVLMVKKKENGQWELPGGRLEPGESHLECLKRELKEELGYNLETLPKNFTNWSNRVDGELLFGRTFIINCLTPFNPGLSSEHSEYKWINIKNQKEYLYCFSFEDSINPEVYLSIARPIINL